MFLPAENLWSHSGLFSYFHHNIILDFVQLFRNMLQDIVGLQKIREFLKPRESKYQDHRPNWNNNFFGGEGGGEDHEY